MGNQNFLETYKNDNTKYQNLWDIAKTLLTGKFIAISECIEKIKSPLTT
jgi:hypothetical protein